MINADKAHIRARVQARRPDTRARLKGIGHAGIMDGLSVFNKNLRGASAFAGCP
jgi:hypothetical protein